MYSYLKKTLYFSLLTIKDTCKEIRRKRRQEKEVNWEEKVGRAEEKGRRNFRGESRKWCGRKGGKATGKGGRENRRKWGGQRMGKMKEGFRGRVGNGVGGKVGKRQGRKEEKIEGKGGQREGKRKEELQERRVRKGVVGKAGKR
jgi:hypothetical protein